MRLDSARADQVSALVFFVLGVAMAIGGYTMDRLEVRQIHPASIPGLVPMILGALLAVCAVGLWLGARQREDGPDTDDVSLGNLGFATFYTVTYALGLVGRMPFELATGIFITVFVLHFTYERLAEGRHPAVWIASAVIYAAICSAAVSALFRYAFLVRLP
ncbi:MAG: tripartite tricarboxylate transporter TctB family protein [Maritimibacter sp.]|nr:tripartite tricarboxylate transporter TctB family protein [Maritimibacter sp.]